MQAFKILIYIVISMSLAACSKTGSSNVKTKGISVSYTVEGNNQNSAICRAQFQVGGSTGTYLELEDGDSVTCQGLPMSKSEFAGIITYTTAVNYSPNGTYTVTFKRSDEPAYIATVTLPPPVTGMNPSAFTSYQKAQPLAVSWTPSSYGGDEMWVQLSYSTINNGSHHIWERGGQPELGSAGFTAYDTTTNPPEAGTFSGSIKFQRERSGTIPSPLSGSIRGIQSVSVPIELRD